MALVAKLVVFPWEFTLLVIAGAAIADWLIMRRGR